MRGIYPDPKGTRCVCLWEAESVDRLRDFMEEAAGAFSQNEYYEVAPEKAFGLPR